MTPLRALATAVWTLALLVSAGAETFRIVNADRPTEFLDVDCPLSPLGRGFDWVADNCTLATAPAGTRKVTVHGWNHKKKVPFVGEVPQDAR